MMGARGSRDGWHVSGSAGVTVALAMGAACVIAPGRSEATLAALAGRFGPRVRTVPLTGQEDQDHERMTQAAPGPIDRVLDLLPPIPDATPVRAAAMTVRPHDTVTLMGGIGTDLCLPYRHLMRNCITVRGQWMYPRDASSRLIQLAHAGLLSLDDPGITGLQPRRRQHRGRPCRGPTQGPSK